MGPLSPQRNQSLSIFNMFYEGSMGRRKTGWLENFGCITLSRLEFPRVRACARNLLGELSKNDGVLL